MGRVLRICTDDEDSIWTELWKGISQWGVHKARRVSIELFQINVTLRSEPSLSLTVLMTPRIELPLSLDSPSSLEWIMPMSVMVQINIHPTNHTRDLVVFLNESRLSGVTQVPTTIPSIHVMCDGWGVYMKILRGVASAQNVPLYNEGSYNGENATLNSCK